MKNKEIDNIREALQTLPNTSKKNYDYDTSLNNINIRLIDYSKNPFKSIVAVACATWGSGGSKLGEGSTMKWSKLTPENRFRIVLASLKGSTLPTALESPSFTFEVNGVPRHTFDQFARCRFFSIGSIGTRDNDKLDAPFLIYDRLSDMLNKDKVLKDRFEDWIVKTKDLYEDIIKNNKGDWQIGRDVLPMCINHSWVFKTDYGTLKSQCGRRMMACEQDSMVLLFWKFREEIKKISPLLADYMRPACDNLKKCIYHGGPEGMTKYFSSLFASCGRWKSGHEYSEFNHSCTDYNRLKEYVEIIESNRWINFEEDDYKKLSNVDKKFFEEK